MTSLCIEEVNKENSRPAHCSCQQFARRGSVFHSILLFLPFGAGSRGVIGVLVYVTVRVTTCLTLTGFPVAERGLSYNLFIFSAFQSADEKGERSADPLWGESAAGDHIGD